MSRRGQAGLGFLLSRGSASVIARRGSARSVSARKKTTPRRQLPRWPLAVAGGLGLSFAAATHPASEPVWDRLLGRWSWNLGIRWPL